MGVGAWAIGLWDSVGPRALLGHTGFVGSGLSRSIRFDEARSSADSGELAGRRFGLLVCCAARAAKWRAKADPGADRREIARLAELLRAIRAERVVLVSTTDVFSASALASGAADEGLDPASAAAGGGPGHAYGENRLWLEREAREAHGRRLTVLRLPALFGAGLRKNALHDMALGRLLDRIDPAAVFQWYDTARLPDDLAAAAAAGLGVAHLAVPPLPTGEVRDLLFPGLAIAAPEGAPPPPLYDLRTRHADVFGDRAGAPYICGADEVRARLAALAARPDRALLPPVAGSDS